MKVISSGGACQNARGQVPKRVEVPTERGVQRGDIRGEGERAAVLRGWEMRYGEVTRGGYRVGGKRGTEAVRNCLV